jgi:MFS family permease
MSALPKLSAEPGPTVDRISDLTPTQWSCGIAAWLGWLFDGLDGTLYLLVSARFVAELLPFGTPSRSVSFYASVIQGAFMLGWALGGAVFGRIGDRYGRSRTMSLSILTYAIFTGLSFFAHAWWHLLIFRFVAALGIGGEWAAGSSLVSETWPRAWREIVSATLQSAYQCGLLLASLAALALAAYDPRYVFLVGVFPALIVFWIQRAVPEPDEWQRAKARHEQRSAPGIRDLFRGDVRPTTIKTILICCTALTTLWAFFFWYPIHLGQLYARHLASLPGAALSAHEIKRQVQHYVTSISILTSCTAIVGNFGAGLMAKSLGYRKAAALMFFGGFLTLFGAYAYPHDYRAIVLWLCAAHFFAQGIFGLFPLYIPPLFPTLIRTTGAGFCYNIGRVVAGVGTVLFWRITQTTGEPNYARLLVCVSLLYIPGVAIALLIPEPPDTLGSVPLSGSVPSEQ